MSAVLDLDPAMILAEAARLRETAVKDKSYRATPIGDLAGRYLDELLFQGYSRKTVEIREGVLYHLAFELAHLQPGEVVHADLQGFLTDRWSGAARNTKASATSAVRNLFAWASDNELIPSNPARRLKSPRDADTERVAHSKATIRRLVTAQTQQRDKVALLTLYWCGLRRMELQQIRFRHIDLANRLLTVFGKGGTILDQNIPGPLALELERHILDRQPHPDDYLLSPQKQLRYGTYPLYRYEMVAKDPREPYTLDGISAWWRRMVKTAGMDPFPMHEMRHTAGTHFHMEGHDLVATQHYLRHKNPATTARTYVHLDRVRAVSDVQKRMGDPLEDETE